MALSGVVGSPAHVTRRGPTEPGNKQDSPEHLTREAGGEPRPGEAAAQGQPGLAGTSPAPPPASPLPLLEAERVPSCEALKQGAPAHPDVRQTGARLQTRPSRGTAVDSDQRSQHQLTKRSGWPPRPPKLRWRTSRLRVGPTRPTRVTAATVLGRH